MEIKYHIGHNCNLRCEYCRIDKENYNNNDYSNILFEEIKNAISKKIKIEKILITGGEPTLYHDYVIKILKNISKYNLPKISITSNGTNIDKLIEYSKYDNVHIVISWDGNKNERGFDSLETIKKLNDENIRFSICHVISNTNYKDVYKNFKILQNINNRLPYAVELLFCKQSEDYYKIDFNIIKEVFRKLYLEFPGISLFSRNKSKKCPHYFSDDTLVEIEDGIVYKGCINFAIKEKFPDAIKCEDNFFNKCYSCDNDICHACANVINPILNSVNNKPLYDGDYYNIHLCKFYRTIKEIVNDETRKRYLKNKFYNNIETIEILVTTKCNLQCKYCFESEIHSKGTIITTETINSIINLYKELSMLNKVPSITLFGGEPLISENYKILKYLFDELIENNIYPSINIITNGIDLKNKKIIELLKLINSKFKLNIQISIDSIKEVNDKNRVFKNGYGTFDIVVNNIKELSNIINYKQISINSVLNYDYIHKIIEWIVYINDELLDKYINSVSFRLNQCDNNPFSHIQDRELIQLNYDIINLYLSGRINKKLFYNFFNIYNYNCERFAHSQTDTGCGICKNFIVISPNGNFYPCHMLLNNKNMIIGNINSWDISERIYDIYDTFDNIGSFRCDDNSCENCVASNTCIKCKAANYIVNKNPRNNFSNHCKIYKNKINALFEHFGEKSFIKNSFSVSELKNDILELKNIYECTNSYLSDNDIKEMLVELNRVSVILDIQSNNQRER